MFMLFVFVLLSSYSVCYDFMSIVINEAYVCIHYGRLYFQLGESDFDDGTKQKNRVTTERIGLVYLGFGSVVRVACIYSRSKLQRNYVIVMEPEKSSRCAHIVIVPY